jgi:hypothetical protein
LEFLQDTNALDVRIRNADIRKRMAVGHTAETEYAVERIAARRIALTKTRYDYDADEYRYVSDLIAELATVVNATEVDRRDHTIDIADMIATKLGLPFSRHVLSGEAITSLRKALLTPAELGNFKATIDLSDRRCAGCERRFLDRELVTFNDSGGEVSIFCATCLSPVSYPCSSCGGIATLAKATQRKLTGGACKACRDKRKQEQNVAAFEELPNQEVNNGVVPIAVEADIPNWLPDVTAAPTPAAWGIQPQHPPVHPRGNPNDEPR